MQFSMLEITLISGLFTALGAVVAGVVIRMLSDKRFVTQSECAARHASDCRMSTQLISKIDELKSSQDKFQEAMAGKNALLFRMLRSMVAHMDLTAEQRERILNERASD
jgi:uncharacterized membrane protein YraQ (UPF0718 family)